MQKSPGGKDYPMPSAVRHSRPLVILKCKMSSGKEQSRWWIGWCEIGWCAVWWRSREFASTGNKMKWSEMKSKASIAGGGTRSQRIGAHTCNISAQGIW